jgi:hypothetical protein
MSNIKICGFVYHSSSVFGGCSNQMIWLCRPQGSVSRYKSINAGESFIPVCATRSQNFELCSVMLPSPRRSFFMSSRASAGSSYGWKVLLRASTNSLYVPQLGLSVFASTLSSIFVSMNCCFQTAASPPAKYNRIEDIFLSLLLYVALFTLR